MKLRRYDQQAEADILSDYVDLLNREGLESSAELRFLRRHEGDLPVSRLLRGVRRLKAALGCPRNFTAHNFPGRISHHVTRIG